MEEGVINVQLCDEATARRRRRVEALRQGQRCRESRALQVACSLLQQGVLCNDQLCNQIYWDTQLLFFPREAVQVSKSR